MSLRLVIKVLVAPSGRHSISQLLSSNSLIPKEVFSSYGVFGGGLASTAVSAVPRGFFVALSLDLVMAFCLIWPILLIRLFHICWYGA